MFVEALKTAGIFRVSKKFHLLFHHSQQVEFEDLADHGLDASISSRVWSVIEETNNRRNASAATSGDSGHSQFTYASQLPDYDPDQYDNMGTTQYHATASTSVSAVQPAPAMAVREPYRYEHTDK